MTPSTEADNPGNFAFILNVADLCGQASYELAPGHTLRRATAQEITVIRQCLQTMPLPSPFNNPGTSGVLWEHRWPELDNELPPDEWRYFVIAFRGSNDAIIAFESVFGASSAPLQLGFTVMRDFVSGGGLGTMSHPGRLFHTIETAYPPRADFFIRVDQSDADEVVDIRKRLRQGDSAVAPFERALRHLSALRELPQHSTMRFLGLFAVLESLLTHPPQPMDPYDSITRQVKKKLGLLNHRFAKPIDYAAFGAPADTVWGKMYAYRSSLAHGGTPDFTSSLATLKDHKHAYDLLAATVRTTVRQGLYEPQLLLDLKDC